MAMLSTTKLSDEFTALTARLMLCSSKSEIINLSGAFGQAIEKLIETENNEKESLGRLERKTSKMKFTSDECAGMDRAFRTQFKKSGQVANVIKRRSGRHSFLYEIRYRRGGYNLSVSSTDIGEARRRFLVETRAGNVERYARNVPKSGQNLFHEIASEWLAYKKGKINERTHQNYESYYRRYLREPLGDIPILKIRTIDLDKLLNADQARLYEDLRTVLNSIFKYAIASGVTTYNPVTLIPFKKASRQSERRALNEEELDRLHNRLNLPEFSPYKRTFLLMLYFGLRPCEVNEVRFEGDFLIARNAKRKGGKIEYKKIPIPNEARERIAVDSVNDAPHRTDVLNRVFKRVMQDEEITQYYLRHTFATVCQQYVRPDIVDIWMGDSSERLVGRVYTHFSDEFMRTQMEQVIFHK